MTPEQRLARKTELLGKCRHCWKNRPEMSAQLPQNGICAQCPGEKALPGQLEMFDIKKEPRRPWLE